MKTRILYIIVITLIFNNVLIADDLCTILYSSPNHENKCKMRSFDISTPSDSYVLRVFFHIIRTSNGTGGHTVDVLDQCMSILNVDFEPLGIQFVMNGYEYINNDSYYYGLIPGGDELIGLLNTNRKSDAINIYLSPTDSQFAGGVAEAIVSNACIVSGNVTYGGVNTDLIKSRVLSHEVGHCLGLYHTFHGTAFFESEDGCRELVNGTNSETCGDYITDTPADPGSLRDYMALQNAVDCEWSNNTLKDENDELYDPDETQIMSYTYPQCMQGFSCMQGIRMRQTIAASSLLQACILSNYVNVQGGVFNAGSYNFYASKDIIVGDITEITGSARVSLRSFGSIYVNPETVIDLNDNGSFSAMASSLTLSTPCSSSDMLYQGVKSTVKGDYHSFLNNSKWFKTYIAEGVHSTFYFMSGDTIIDNMLYYKINQRNIKLPGVLNNPNIRLWNINFSYPYLFREDIENKKVFIRSGKSESLLYDFNLKEGDIMPDNSSFRLIKIDSVEIYSGIRKRFTFQSTFADYTAVWIEGVGNIAHPFVNYMYVVGQQDINQLLCAYQNDNIIYENCILPKSETKLVECIDYYNSETGYQNVEINGCKISPNPTNGQVNISLPNGTLNSIRVIDVNGRVLRDYRYDLTESTVSIDISSFASGVYYCVVATEHETGTYKVIKF